MNIKNLFKLLIFFIDYNFSSENFSFKEFVNINSESLDVLTLDYLNNNFSNLKTFDDNQIQSIVLYPKQSPVQLLSKNFIILFLVKIINVIILFLIRNNIKPVINSERLPSSEKKNYINKIKSNLFIINIFLLLLTFLILIFLKFNSDQELKYIYSREICVFILNNIILHMKIIQDDNFRIILIVITYLIYFLEILFIFLMKKTLNLNQI